MASVRADTDYSSRQQCKVISDVPQRFLRDCQNEEKRAIRLVLCYTKTTPDWKRNKYHKTSSYNSDVVRQFSTKGTNQRFNQFHSSRCFCLDLYSLIKTHQDGILHVDSTWHSRELSHLIDLDGWLCLAFACWLWQGAHKSPSINTSLAASGNLGLKVGFTIDCVDKSHMCLGF